MNRNEQIYSILKAIKDGKEPTHEEYKLNHEQWLDLVSFILDNGYANIKVSRGGRGNRVRAVWIDGATLTDKGVKYLTENMSNY